MAEQVKVDPPSAYNRLSVAFSKCIEPFGSRKIDHVNVARFVTTVVDVAQKAAITPEEKNELLGKVRMWLDRTTATDAPNTGKQRAPEIVLLSHEGTNWNEIVKHSKDVLEAPPPEKKTAMHYYNLLASLNALLIDKGITAPEQGIIEVGEKMKFLLGVIVDERNGDTAKVEAIRPELERIDEYVRLEAKGLGLNVQG